MRTLLAGGGIAETDRRLARRTAKQGPRAPRPATRAALFIVLAATLWAGPARAQALETFGGHARATEDVMFFTFFRKPAPEGGTPVRSDVLFFFRARASVDYSMTETSNLPQFGLTSAVSYNPRAWKGFAPVFVVQVLNRGAFAKAGVQFARTGRRATVFSWLVCETDRQPVVDVFILGRYIHPLNGATGLFLQGESVNALPTAAADQYSFTQRLRAGVQVHRWQFGPGVDITRTGRATFAATTNIGVFVRYEF
jgi:hypothetical protein